MFTLRLSKMCKSTSITVIHKVAIRFDFVKVMDVVNVTGREHELVCFAGVAGRRECGMTRSMPNQ